MSMISYNFETIDRIDFFKAISILNKQPYKKYLKWKKTYRYLRL
jgi:hypothetical protein